MKKIIICDVKKRRELLRRASASFASKLLNIMLHVDTSY